MTEKIYCNLYRRVSSKKQEKGLSLEVQEKFLKNWAKENGYLVIEDFRATESAKEEGRIEFNRMIKSCLENNIKHILVEKTDRLQRNKKDEVYIEDLIKKHDFEFHLVKENRVLNRKGSSTDQLLGDILGAISRHKSSNLREEVEKGLKEKITRNELPCQAPIGYENVPRTTKGSIRIKNSPDFEKVKKVLLFFNNGGWSLNDIIMYAEKIGLKSKAGNTFHKSTMWWILRNPFYYGEFIYGGERYKNETPGFEAMITKKQYDKNQKILEDQKRNTSNERGKTDWKFKGIITCGKCGRAYLAEKTDIPYKSKKTGKINKHYYIGYHCTRGVYFADEKGTPINKELVEKDESGNYYYRYKSKIVYLEKKKCDTGTIQENDLGRLLSQEFSGLKFKRNKWNTVRAKILEGKDNERKKIRKEVTLLKSEQGKNKKKREALFDSKINGDIPEDFFKEQMEKTKDKLIEIEGEIEYLEGQETLYDGKIEDILGIVDTVDGFGEKFKEATPEVRRGMVRLMVSKILITGGEKKYITDAKGNDKMVRVPFSLYVDWNDEFKDLYDVDLVVLPKDLEVKYKLSRRSVNSPKTTFTAQHNNLR